MRNRVRLPRYADVTTKTPLTDAALCTAHERASNYLREMVPADFARALELECARLREEIDEAEHAWNCAAMRPWDEREQGPCDCFKSRALTGGGK